MIEICWEGSSLSLSLPRHHHHPLSLSLSLSLSLLVMCVMPSSSVFPFTLVLLRVKEDWTRFWRNNRRKKKHPLQELQSIGSYLQVEKETRRDRKRKEQRYRDCFWPSFRMEDFVSLSLFHVPLISCMSFLMTDSQLNLIFISSCIDTHSMSRCQVKVNFDSVQLTNAITETMQVEAVSFPWLACVISFSLSFMTIYVGWKGVLFSVSQVIIATSLMLHPLHTDVDQQPLTPSLIVTEFCVFLSHTSCPCIADEKWELKNSPLSFVRLFNWI